MLIAKLLIMNKSKIYNHIVPISKPCSSFKRAMRRIYDD